MEDTAEDVERKLRQAYCPVKPEPLAPRVEGEDAMQLKEDPLMNPCLDYIQHIIFCVPSMSITALLLLGLTWNQMPPSLLLEKNTITFHLLKKIS